MKRIKESEEFVVLGVSAWKRDQRQNNLIYEHLWTVPSWQALHMHTLIEPSQ